MRKHYDLGTLGWKLAGWTPYVWQQERSIEAGVSNNAEVPGVPARVPGSVQGALREAGVLPDWNVGLNARLCEWVENRHWIYTARLPDHWLDVGASIRLQALGLDYSGWVLFNSKEIGRFQGTFVPHTFDLTPSIRAHDNTLQIVFDCPPRWLGQIGYTSEMKEWKERFNYFWDWTSRLVQLGIWDDLVLEVTDGEEITGLHCVARADVPQATGSLRVTGSISGGHASSVSVSLVREGSVLLSDTVPAEDFLAGITWEGLPVDFWWPNGEGEQPLYTVICRLTNGNGETLDEVSTRTGFKNIDWEPCEAAPPEADPWICVVNGRPVFLQGVNWTPILPNFADVTHEQYRHLLETYRDLGCKMLRVWGGAFLEKENFYQLCDELGLLVWQEFPLSSSGLDNYPPDDSDSVEQMAVIGASYVKRRRNHVSLTLWSGGNELQTLEGKPLDLSHPMLARLAEVVAREDPQRRFLPTSPGGPSFSADEEHFGQGIHWDVHGPWRATGHLNDEWTRYWRDDDALFHSEIGAPGASPAEIIRAYKGDLEEVPGTIDNPLWQQTSWWIEWPEFVEEQGREPADLEEFVVWNQERQRRALAIAARSARGRFPRCGGFLIWMGHDSFPCAANTSIIDFHGNLKPAALEIGKIYREME